MTSDQQRYKDAKYTCTAAASKKTALCKGSPFILSGLGDTQAPNGKNEHSPGKARTFNLSITC
jgi:hypothetical protein